MDLLVGGWQITNTTTYGTGLPFTPSIGECGNISDAGCRTSQPRARTKLACWQNNGSVPEWSSRQLRLLVHANRAPYLQPDSSSSRARLLHLRAAGFRSFTLPGCGQSATPDLILSRAACLLR